MNKSVLLSLVFIMILHFEVNGVTPVHVGEANVDTSIYQYYDFTSYTLGPSGIPATLSTDRVGLQGGSTMFVQAFRKKTAASLIFFPLTVKSGLQLFRM